MRKIIILYLIFFNYLTSASDSKIDCDNAYTQFDMTYCANEDFKKADKELNQLYQAILKHTSEEETNVLKNPQIYGLNCVMPIVIWKLPGPRGYYISNDIKYVFSR